jgi:hypothetical protein
MGEKYMYLTALSLKVSSGTSMGITWKLSEMQNLRFISHVFETDSVCSQFPTDLYPQIADSLHWKAVQKATVCSSYLVLTVSVQKRKIEKYSFVIN